VSLNEQDVSVELQYTLSVYALYASISSGPQNVALFSATLNVKFWLALAASVGRFHLITWFPLTNVFDKGAGEMLLSVSTPGTVAVMMLLLTVELLPLFVTVIVTWPLFVQLSDVLSMPSVIERSSAVDASMIDGRCSAGGTTIGWLQEEVPPV